MDLTWFMAIGLQAVDGLSTSEYLKENAKRNIEGEITVDAAGRLIKSYYQSKTQCALDYDIEQDRQFSYKGLSTSIG